MLETFTRQLAAGLPLTLTDPASYRYFMSVDEAVDLLVHAGAVGEPGEVLIMKIEVSTKIEDLAHRLIRASGSDAEIIYTGGRLAERTWERFIGVKETMVDTDHKLIWRVPVPGFPIDSEWQMMYALFDSLAVEGMRNPALVAKQLIHICDWRIA